MCTKKSISKSLHITGTYLLYTLCLAHLRKAVVFCLHALGSINLKRPIQRDLQSSFFCILVYFDKVVHIYFVLYLISNNWNILSAHEKL